MRYSHIVADIYELWLVYERRKPRMKIYEYKVGMRLDAERVIALGLFDGVHLGHRELIDVARRRADELSVPLAVFTFAAEDTRLKGGERIYSTERKLELLSTLSVDEVILASFSELSGVSAEDFALALPTLMGCKTAVSGRDFRFGRGAIGDVSLLCEVLNSHGAELITVDDVVFDGRKVSTTYIKELLSLGRVREAATLLAAPFVSDRLTVVHGNGAGRAFGYPTLNTSPPSLLPSGVYLTRVKIDGKLYTGMTNIGTCPTFAERERHAETYILDFSSDVYESEVEIYFIDYIREERRFSSEDDLINQLETDRAFVVNYNLH